MHVPLPVAMPVPAQHARVHMAPPSVVRHRMLKLLILQAPMPAVLQRDATATEMQQPELWMLWMLFMVQWIAFAAGSYSCNDKQ